MEVVDCEEFRDLLLYIGLQLEDHNIPHCTRLSELITECFKVEYNQMLEEIRVGQSSVLRVQKSHDFVEFSLMHLTH
jgi:hypothetical protein